MQVWSAGFAADGALQRRFGAIELRATRTGRRKSRPGCPNRFTCGASWVFRVVSSLIAQLGHIYSYDYHICRARAKRADPCRGRRPRLYRTDTRPGAVHPAGARRPRHRCLRTDGHGQDLRLCPPRPSAHWLNQIQCCPHGRRGGCYGQRGGNPRRPQAPSQTPPAQQGYDRRGPHQGTRHANGAPRANATNAAPTATGTTRATTPTTIPGTAKKTSSAAPSGPTTRRTTTPAPKR